jgi:hypothetical protein
MLYRVTVKRLIDSRYYARCDAAPQGLAEGHGESEGEALEQIRKAIRFQLEYCPCSGVAGDFVELQVIRARATPS